MHIYGIVYICEDETIEFDSMIVMCVNNMSSFFKIDKTEIYVQFRRHAAAKTPMSATLYFVDTRTPHER